jgi:peptidoglycan/LPS O-acetylase OafA/YrhL
MDGLRALAALWVVLHHAWYQVSSRASGFIAHIINVPLSHGRLAVDVFIVISGFCLMFPVIQDGGELRRGPIGFLKRRAWRILPPYYFALMLSLLLIGLFIGHPTGTQWDISLPVTIRSVLTHFLLLHDTVGDDFSINHVFWSIAVEWRIYFLFPVLILGWHYLGPVKTTFLGLMVSWLLNWFCLHFIGASMTWEYLGLFASGMLGAGIVFSSSAIFVRLRELSWVYMTSAVALLVVITSSIWRANQFEDYAIGFLATSVIIMTSLNHSAWYHRLLSFPPLVFVGTFAYSIYLVHAPFLQLLWQYPYAPMQSQPLLMFGLLIFPGMPLIVSVSYLFFIFCERPFLNKREAKGSLSRDGLALTGR